MEMKQIARLAPIAMLAMAGSHASAAGFQLQEQNASGLGNAFAGTAVAAENASIIFNNPAGMVLLSGEREASVGLNLVNYSTEFDNDGSAFPSFVTQGNGDGGDAGSLNAIPNAYFAWKITPRVSLGLGISAPFGLKTEYDDDWVGRFLAVESEIKTVNINPSVAFKVNDVVSLGLGVSYQQLDAKLSNMVNFSNPFVSNLEGLGTVEADSWAWGWNVGAIFQISPTTRLGVAYRSKIEHDLEGDVEFDRPVSGIPIVDAGIAAQAADGDVDATVELPDTFTFSVSQMLSDKWEMLGDVSWTGWSSLESLDIYRTNGTLLSSETLEWRDTWRIALGANYKYSDTLKFRFGVAYDQSPVTSKYRLARLPDTNRTWLALGMQYKPTPTSALDVGYAHLFINEASIDTDGGNAAAKGTLVGDYTASVDILGVQYSVGF